MQYISLAASVQGTAPAVGLHIPRDLPGLPPGLPDRLQGLPGRLQGRRAPRPGLPGLRQDRGRDPDSTLLCSVGAGSAPPKDPRMQSIRGILACGPPAQAVRAVAPSISLAGVPSVAGSFHFQPLSFIKCSDRPLVEYGNCDILGLMREFRMEGVYL